MQTDQTLPDLDGLQFVAFMNSHKRFFIPSTQNSFGILQIEKVLVDTSCSSILLPLYESNLLSHLNIAYPCEDQNSTMVWKLARSKGVGGRTDVLVIENSPSVPLFDVKLMGDVGFLPNCTLKLTKLRISLCGDDFRYIINHPELLKNFSTKQQESIRNQEHSTLLRRSHALLGQDVLSKFSCIRYGQTALYVDVLKFKLPAGWGSLTRLIIDIKDHIEVPETFQDWEDFDDQYDDEDVDLSIDVDDGF
jgi:hypothetical protein